jgi:competence protein ComFC
MHARGLFTIRTIQSILYDWLFPPRCLGCNKLGEAICNHCRDSIPIIKSKVCRICGTPIYSREIQGQHSCIDAEFLSEVRSAALFQGVIRKAVIALKYRNRRYYADALVKCCIPYWPIQRWNIDLIIPIPSTAMSIAKRGYNQSELLAEALSGFSRIPWSTKYLQKKENIKTQVGLSALDRKRNIKNAFRCDNCKGLTLLLIDDVCTTGATLQSAAESLKDAEAKRVFGVTIARTLDRKQNIQSTH